jgi:hypothetical protein
MVCTLTVLERKIGKLVGATRMKESAKNKRRPHWKDSKGGTILANHRDGATAELVVAKVLQTYYEPRLNNFKGADLLQNIEVRSTKAGWFGVKIKPSDSSKRIVVAVRKVNSLEWMILGWIRCKHGKKRKWLKDPQGRGRPAYFVPEEFLQPIEKLPIIRVREV